MTAHKNRGNTTANHWRQAAIFYSLLLMIVSIVISRGALSVSCILFATLAIVRKDFLQQVKKFISSPYLVAVSVLFFIPFISGLWSDDLNQWMDVVRLKLPLLFFPIAFAGEWKLSSKQWLTVAAFFLLIVFGGCVWGLSDYAQNTETINESYRRAKTILTPLEDDHVRFSWVVGVAIILCCLLLQLLKDKRFRLLLVMLAIFFAVYLHILSARTGLFSLYISLFIFAGWMIFKSQAKKLSALLLFSVFALPVMAYFMLPTFKERLHYILYDLSFVQKEQYLPGSSDGARMMSLKAGWQVLQQNPLGVGAGDIMTESNKWYTQHVPEVLSTDKFYPSSEWLMYGGFAGWPGVILFSLVMCFPFFVQVKRFKIVWIAFHTTAAFSFAFDMGLEVQYGIFLYAFISFWWWKWLNNFEYEG